MLVSIENSHNRRKSESVIRKLQAVAKVEPQRKEIASNPAYKSDSRLEKVEIMGVPVKNRTRSIRAQKIIGQMVEEIRANPFLVKGTHLQPGQMLNVDLSTKAKHRHIYKLETAVQAKSLHQMSKIQTIAKLQRLDSRRGTTFNDSIPRFFDRTETLNNQFLNSTQSLEQKNKTCVSVESPELLAASEGTKRTENNETMIFEDQNSLLQNKDNLRLSIQTKNKKKVVAYLKPGTKRRYQTYQKYQYLDSANQSTILEENFTTSQMGSTQVVWAKSRGIMSNKAHSYAKRYFNRRSEKMRSPENSSPSPHNNYGLDFALGIQADSKTLQFRPLNKIKQLNESNLTNKFKTQIEELQLRTQNSSVNEAEGTLNMQLLGDYFNSMQEGKVKVLVSNQVSVEKSQTGNFPGIFLKQGQIQALNKLGVNSSDFSNPINMIPTSLRAQTASDIHTVFKKTENDSFHESRQSRWSKTQHQLRNQKSKPQLKQETMLSAQSFQTPTVNTSSLHTKAAASLDLAFSMPTTKMVCDYVIKDQSEKRQQIAVMDFIQKLQLQEQKMASIRWALTQQKSPPVKKAKGTCIKLIDKLQPQYHIHKADSTVQQYMHFKRQRDSKIAKEHKLLNNGMVTEFENWIRQQTNSSL